MEKIKNVIFFICIIFLAGCLKFEGYNNTLQAFDIKKIEFDDQTYPVVICGGGPGGLTAAIYLAQANIKTLVLEGPTPGGAITMSHSVRNWPGEKEIPGTTLMAKIKEQAILNGAQIVSQEVISVNFSIWPYVISIKDLISGQTKELKALSCIIAMGTKPNYLSIPGEQDYWGKGVSNCATCDGPLYKDKIVAIVGGGDSAIQEANYLSRIAKKVFIIVRSNKLRAKEKFAKEVLQLPNVKVLYNTQIKEIIGDGNKITKLILSNKKTQEELQADGLFLAIGSTPNTKLFENQLELDSKGFIVLKKEQQTSKKGIFSLGDISDTKYKQAITAAGDGCKAAMQAQRFLEKIGYLSEPQKATDTKEPVVEKAQEAHKALEIESPDFNRVVLESTIPVVVDFFTTWCMPCQRMAPIVENLAKSYEGKIKFVKINLDKNKDLAEKFGITSVPTFIFLKDGKEIKKFIGAKTFEDFKQIIDQTF